MARRQNTSDIQDEKTTTITTTSATALHSISNNNLLPPSLHVQESLRINLSHIISDKELSDVTFIVGSSHNGTGTIETFHAIRALFAAQSEIFRNMLFGNYFESIRTHKDKDNCDNSVIIEDVTPAAFNFIFHMFYFQKPSLNVDIVVDILYASQKYLITSLINQSQQFLLNIEKAKNWYKIMISFSKYPQSTFYPFFKIFIKSCKALNIANCIKHQHKNDINIKNIHMRGNIVTDTDPDPDLYDNDNDPSDDEYYYYDKYLLLNDHSFEKYIKYWQIIEMLQSGINDERMFKACIKWSKYQILHSISTPNIVCNKWSDFMKYFLKYFDFTKFNVNYICDEINQMNFISKDAIINILKCKFNRVTAVINDNDNDNKSSQSQIESDSDGFHMNEMLLSDTDLSSLRIGDKIDHRDYKGRWCKASITAKQFMFIKLHYVGWNTQYDTWIHLSEDYEKLAKYGRITRRQVQRKKLQNLNINDRVLIRLPSCHRFHYMSWIKAKVSYIEDDTGQIKFAYGITNTSDAKYSWWTHPDNLDECKPVTKQSQQQQQPPNMLVLSATNTDININNITNDDNDDNDDDDDIKNDNNNDNSNNDNDNNNNHHILIDDDGSNEKDNNDDDDVEEEEEEDDDDDDGDDEEIDTSDHDHNVIGNGVSPNIQQQNGNHDDNDNDNDDILAFDDDNNDNDDNDDDNNNTMILCD